MTERALDAAERWRSAASSVGVLHVPTIKPFDAEAVAAFAGVGRRSVVTAENHVVVGGLASLVVEALFDARRGEAADAASACPTAIIECGSVPHLQARYGLTTEAIESPTASPRLRSEDRRMRITEIETYTVGAGWKNWLFVKVHHRRRHPRHRRGHAERLHPHHRSRRARARSISSIGAGPAPHQRAGQAHARQRLARRRPHPPHRDRRGRGRLLGHSRQDRSACRSTSCSAAASATACSATPTAGTAPSARRRPSSRRRRAVLAKGFKAFKLDPFGTAQGFISRGRARPRLRHLPHAARKAAGATRCILIDVHARFTEIAALQAARRMAPTRHLLVGGADHRATARRRCTRSRSARRSRSRPARCTTPSASSSRWPSGGGVNIFQPEPMSLGGISQHAGGGEPGAGAWQLHRAASERRPGGDRGLPAARRLRAELPDPGAFRRLQRAVDARPRHLASDDRSRERPPVAARRAGPRHRPQHRVALAHPYDPDAYLNIFEEGWEKRLGSRGEAKRA